MPAYSRRYDNNSAYQQCKSSNAKYEADYIACQGFNSLDQESTVSYGAESGVESLSLTITKIWVEYPDGDIYWQGASHVTDICGVEVPLPEYPKYGQKFPDSMDWMIRFVESGEIISDDTTTAGEFHRFCDFFDNF